MTICIVDDHPLMREALATVMSRLRPDMLIVELGRVHDLELLKDSAERPTVIFLDLNLPDAKGWSGVSQVKTNFPAVPLAVYLRDSRARHESRRKPSRSVCNPHRHQP